MKEFDLFFQLIVDALSDGPVQTADKKADRIDEYVRNWKELHDELEMQTILGLPYRFVSRNLKLSMEEMAAYRLEVFQTASNFYSNMLTQAEIIDLFENNDIPHVVLKGSAAAVYYREPEVRAMGDIDILVKPDSFEKAYNILCANGYEAEPFNPNKRHNELFKNGHEIELHLSFATLKDEKRRDYLDQLIYKGVDERIYEQIGEDTFPMLPHMVNGLTLLCHMDYHMEEGPGIRHLLDWMFFAQKNLDDQHWNGEFEKEAEAIGLKTMAKVLTKCCRKYLGMAGEITWCEDADDALCDELMSFIMDFGNFGAKNQDSILRGNILYMLKKPSEYIRFAQTFGLRTWKALDKHPGLKPFAWIYQSFRFLSHGLKKGSDLGNSLEDFKTMERKNNLLKQIKSQD